MKLAFRHALLLVLVALLQRQGWSVFRLTTPAQHRVMVGGSSGYVGRAVVQELVARGISTTALVRSVESLSDVTLEYLKGSNIVQCNVLDEREVEEMSRLHKPNVAICCLASRNGLGKDAYAVDYGGGISLLKGLAASLDEQEKDRSTSTGAIAAAAASAAPSPAAHYVLLSAFCCGKPLLQFQLAKLKLEEELKTFSPSISHSIIRPTAYFKSLDGQIEAVRKGNSIMYFGSGQCAANAICEKDLAAFMVDAALQPERIGMLDTTRNVGGPDVPPIEKRQQGELIYDALNVPKEKRKFIALPLKIFDVLLSIASGASNTFTSLGLKELGGACEDAAEIVRIVKYYATGKMSPLRTRSHTYSCQIPMSNLKLKHLLLSPFLTTSIQNPWWR